MLVRDIEKDQLPAAQAYNLGLLPYYPLANGLLTGRYKTGTTIASDSRFGKVPSLQDKYVTPRNTRLVEALDAFARERGHTLLELAFSWLAGRPQVASVIAGASSPEQIEQNAKAVSWELSADDYAEIDHITAE